MKIKESKIKKALLAFIISFMPLVFAVSVTANADCLIEIAGICEDEGGDDDKGSLSFAQYSVGGSISTVESEGYDSALTESSSLKDFIIKIVNFALSFLGLIAVVMVIYGGILYVTAGGESERAEKGKKNILYSVIGLIIVMGSFALVNTVISAGGGTGTGGESAGSTIGSRNKASFNAAAAQVQAIGKKIYDDYVFLNDVTEELKSVATDAQKQSIQWYNIPDKMEIVSFLRSVKSKVQNVENKTSKFSRTYTYANQLIRDIDLQIDEINSLGGEVYADTSGEGKGDERIVYEYDGHKVYECDSYVYTQNCYKYKDDTNTCTESQDEYCRRSGYKKYPASLPERWNILLQDYKGLDTAQNCPEVNNKDMELIGSEVNLYSIICSVRNDLYYKLKDEYLPQLYQVWKFISVVDAISKGDASGYYDLMMAALSGYNGVTGSNIYVIDENGDILDTYNTDSFIKSIAEWALDTQNLSASKWLTEGLTNLAKFRDEILKIQFVNAVLSADVAQGNAPLSVVFDVFDSVDPAGGTLDGDKITWDLGGQYMAESLELSGDEDQTEFDTYVSTDIAELGMNTESTPKIFECDYVNQYIDSGTGMASEAENADVNNSNDANLRKTSVRCTYYYPGVYNAAVKIDSRNPKLYAPGLAVLPIVVNPPKTMINLTVDGSQSDPQDVMKYGSDGFLEVSKREVGFTLSEATAGITFSAVNSKPTPKKYKWYFGDGTTAEGNDAVTHEYKQLGKYQVKLEVTNNSGIVDRAIFYVNVAELVAKISPVNKTLFINNPIKFDGSGSRSDLGILTQYEWKLTDKDGNDVQDTDVECESNNSGPGVKTYTCTFKQYGTYNMKLAVLNSAGAKADTTMEFKVRSQVPEPVIETEVPKASQPSTVKISGAKSYDPDQYDSENPIELAYKWKISKENGSATEGTDYDWVEPASGADSAISPTIHFYKKGSYNIKLTVCDVTNTSSPCNADTNLEHKSLTKVYEVEDNVDIEWGDIKIPSISQIESASKDSFNAEVEVEFASYYVNKDNGKISYKVDFGDGETVSGSYPKTTSFLSKYLFAAIIPPEDLSKTIKEKHIYKTPGEYTVTLTIYDEDDNDKTITRKIFIPDGETPYAKIKVLVNEAEMTGLICETDDDKFWGDTKPCAVKVTSKDTLTFDASDSMNKDGTGKDLRYSWDFKDGAKSTEKTTTHKYAKPSGESAFVEADLTVYDKNDPAAKDTKTVFILVESSPPQVSAIVPLADSANPNMKAPLKVDLRAYGAEDKDGEIVQYRWFYYKQSDFISGKVEESKRMGAQITKEPKAQVTIGSWSGKENETAYFGFGVEVKDNDGKTATVYTAAANKMTVKNGANKPPIAKFTTGKTKVMVDEPVTFSSFSSDPDGTIKFYEWNFGDGTVVKGEVGKDQNYPQIIHIYEKKNLSGYGTTLKIIDDGGSEVVSDTTNISVDSTTLPPTAAFTIKGAAKKIRFDASNSKADDGVKLVKYSWDFNTEVDSDGDGVRDNDVDLGTDNPAMGEVVGVGKITKSSQTQPEFEYDNIGVVNVKLTVVDEEGNKDDVINKLTLPMGNPPVAAFTYKISGDNIQFTNMSTAAVGIASYSWDFDAMTDSDGNGIKDDDTDSTIASPTYKYSTNGNYNVKLMVTDTNGNSNSVTNTVKYEKYEALNAVLLSTPERSYDGIVYLNGTSGNIIWDFSRSSGKIIEYIIDKNIYYAGDVELKFTRPGTISTMYESSWGKTVTKLTVKDAEGSSHSTTVEVKFK